MSFLLQNEPPRKLTRYIAPGTLACSFGGAGYDDSKVHIHVIG